MALSAIAGRDEAGLTPLRDCPARPRYSSARGTRTIRALNLALERQLKSMTESSFEFLREGQIPSLNITTVQAYRHRATGARYFHLASQDTNNAFVVAFRTVPQDSTGVAHILEHTTLCGSRRYPVRDPFFMMLRRSLNTFMNAFTASDWTAYPFASQNRKDFDNLLAVYLDAVFFPILDPLDFAQEGHRVEFAAADDPTSALVFKGVVFNEMKGAMSSPVRRVWQTLQSNLFPATTYHYNSGGEPDEIPNLTYAQLEAFHAKHYHPSNAVFMTYGNFPVAEHQENIERLALSQFERLELDLSIPDERRYPSPIGLESVYPLEGEEDTARKSHIVLGWLLGKSADLRATMNAELLSGVLLDNSASPLRKALETTELGSAPSELCGLDADMRETVFACGVEGSDPGKAAGVEELVLDVLENVAANGVPQDRVEAVLHQLELNQREIGGGRFPYGLQLIIKALSATLHGGDPVAILDLDPVLTELREDIQNPDFIKSLTRDLLLDNPHRVRLSVAPDKELSRKRGEAEAERLAAMKTAMSEQDKIKVTELAEALKNRQETLDDPEVLPKVGLEDVADTVPIPEGRENHVEGMPAMWFAQGTNGLVYEQVVAELPPLDDELLDDLPLFCECVTEVGCAERDYLQTQAWQASISGGISARTSVRSRIDDIQSVRGAFVIASKALARNQSAVAELLYETFFKARFDELTRLRELIAQMRAYREAQVTGHGHGLAMTAASAGMGPIGRLAQRWSGLEGLKRLKALDKALESETALAALAQRLERIRDALINTPRQLLVVGEDKLHASVHEALDAQWKQAPAVANENRFALAPVSRVVKEGWTTNTEVNFCAKAYPSVSQDHADAPALMVLGPFLRNGFLHRTIREQGGAYGAGAGYNNDNGAFRFFSYRDPRVSETLADFERAVDWLLDETHEPRQMEEAILGVISDIDRPESPAGEAIGTFFSALHGRTSDWRQDFRQRILKVTLDDLQRVAKCYLQPEAASVAVITSQQTFEAHPDLGLEHRSV